jgi:two-component system, chemotaxis family, chemotaxis protein CheY
VPDLPRKILVVEDSPMMVQLYRLVLERAGTELVVASTGVDGLDRAAQEPDVELFIVDINMPELDGIEFLRQLRTDLGITGVPAIVISTESEDADRKAAFEAGATAYLQKPWAPEQLLETIARVTGTRPAA